MNVDAYLDRIGYAGPRAPEAATLRALHRAHLLAVPFENLDIALGRPLALDEAALFDKIVRRGRGGFCYELNSLFAALLRALGFDVALLSARVLTDGQPGPEFDHMTLLVQRPADAGAPGPQRCLADVGFGASFLEPLPPDSPDLQRQAPGIFRVSRSGDQWWMHAADFFGVHVRLEPVKGRVPQRAQAPRNEPLRAAEAA